MRLIMLLTCGLNSLTIGQLCFAQEAPSAPSERDHHAIVYDAGRSKIVLFGGYRGSDDTYFEDTWELDQTGWKRLKVAGPETRSSHAMIYDDDRKGVLLHGGRLTRMQSLGDLWLWDGKTWARVGLWPQKKDTMPFDAF